jgi:hypothetical protein
MGRGRALIYAENTEKNFCIPPRLHLHLTQVQVSAFSASRFGFVFTSAETHNPPQGQARTPQSGLPFAPSGTAIKPS